MGHRIDHPWGSMSIHKNRTLHSKVYMLHKHALMEIIYLVRLCLPVTILLNHLLGKWHLPDNEDKFLISLLYINAHRSTRTPTNARACTHADAHARRQARKHTHTPTHTGAQARTRRRTRTHRGAQAHTRRRTRTHTGAQAHTRLLTPPQG